MSNKGKNKSVQFVDKRAIRKEEEIAVKEITEVKIEPVVNTPKSGPDLTDWKEAVDKINTELEKNKPAQHVPEPIIHMPSPAIVEKPPVGSQEIKQSDKDFKLSFIEDYEIEEAEKLIEAHLGFERPRPCGAHMAVKIFVRPDEIASWIDPVTKEKKIFALPSSARAHDKFTSCVALVLAQGPEAYKGKRFEEHWGIRFLRIFFNRWMPKRTKFPWCRVGDWIVIARHEGVQVNYRGIPMQYIYDDRALGIISDPEHVTRD